jgi:hypothetical protein
VPATFADLYSQQTAAAMLELLGEQRRIQHGLEKQVLAVMKLTGPFQRLLTLPGIGNILGLTIQLESGPITRFASAGHYASYCCTVNSRCESDGKKKGEANRKNGNQYLAWAYVEAAHFAQRYSPRAQRWFARKLARKGRAVAVKALACKLAKAAFYVLRDRGGLRRGQTVWSSNRRQPQARFGVGSQPADVIGSVCRQTFTADKDRLFCPHREPTRVGRPDPIGASHRIVSLNEWTRCGTEGCRP